MILVQSEHLQNLRTCSCFQMNLQMCQMHDSFHARFHVADEAGHKAHIDVWRFGSKARHGRTHQVQTVPWKGFLRKWFVRLIFDWAIHISFNKSTHFDAHVQIAPQVHFLFVRLFRLLARTPPIPDHLRQRVVLGSVEQCLRRCLLFDQMRSTQVTIRRRIHMAFVNPMTRHVIRVVIATPPICLRWIATWIAPLLLRWRLLNMVADILIALNSTSQFLGHLHGSYTIVLIPTAVKSMNSGRTPKPLLMIVDMRTTIVAHSPTMVIQSDTLIAAGLRRRVAANGRAAGLVVLTVAVRSLIVARVRWVRVIFDGRRCAAVRFAAKWIAAGRHTGQRQTGRRWGRRWRRWMR